MIITAISFNRVMYNPKLYINIPSLFLFFLSFLSSTICYGSMGSFQPLPHQQFLTEETAENVDFLDTTSKPVPTGECSVAVYESVVRSRASPGMWLQNWKLFVATPNISSFTCVYESVVRCGGFHPQVNRMGGVNVLRNLTLF